jgi:hypothetical protein
MTGKSISRISRTPQAFYKGPNGKYYSRKYWVLKWPYGFQMIWWLGKHAVALPDLKRYSVIQEIKLQKWGSPKCITTKTPLDSLWWHGIRLMARD